MEPMIRTSIFATAMLAFGAAATGTAGAQAFHESNAPIQVPAGAGNVVGGGVARLIGGGDNSVVQHETGGQAQAGRAARLGTTGGGHAEVTYLEPIPAGARGRDAMLLGGGDSAVVVYRDAMPTRRRG
jgi:hypothetical protein